MEFARDFRLKYRRTLRAAALAIIFTVGFCLISVGFAQTQVSGQRMTIAKVSSTVSQPSTPTAEVTSAPTPSTATHNVNLPHCSSITFGLPSTVSLVNAPAGLSIQTDQPTKYQVYGDTADQLRSQLMQCGPGESGSTGAEFTGQTDYNLNWQYDTTAIASMCMLGNIKVGLHTAIALPSWQPTDNATNGLVSRWLSFVSSLYVHEEGHVAIDKTYATKLVTDLNAIGPTPCDQLPSKIRSVTSADSDALNQANDTYDTNTGHGASQGALLPTE